MLRWLPEGYSDRFQDAVSSLNGQTQKIYGCDLVLADYRQKPGTLTSLEEIWNAFADTEKVIETLPGHPGDYLRAMLPGFQMILKVMQGDNIPYTEQIAAMQEIESKLITDEQITELGEKLDRLLHDLGYHQSTMAEKTMTFLEDTVLPADEVVSTTKAFLKRCQDACRAKVLDLPEGDGIDEVKGLHNVIFSGNSAYLGNYKGRLSFNLDRPWSMPTFGNVLCHEGYPGHHAFYCHWDVLYQNDQLPLEGAYYVKNTPTNALFEGVPENALHFLGWDDMEQNTPEIDDLQKKHFLAGRMIQDIHRMYQQNACHFVNIDGMSKDDAVEYMFKSGLFQRSECESAYRFFTDATRRTYYPSYYYGRWLVANAYALFPQERKSDFYRLVYDNPHTNSTFIKAVQQATGKTFEPFATNL